MPIDPFRRPFEPMIRRFLHAYWRFSRGLTVGVRAVIFDGEGRVFLVKHSYLSGWHLPGGGVETGETLLAALARELHDELGGLLVGARMDISWAEQHLPNMDPDVKIRLHRVQQNLSAGVDLKRRIIEELRPTLLDNVGVFAALRWQLKETCGNAGLDCVASFPEEEPRFTSEAAIALFRIAQEGFTNILKHSSAKSMDITLGTDGDAIVMQISDDGKGIPASRLSAIGSHGLASMRHRVRALGGRLDVRSPASGGTTLLVQIPAANALQSQETV